MSTTVYITRLRQIMDDLVVHAPRHCVGFDCRVRSLVDKAYRYELLSVHKWKVHVSYILNICIVIVFICFNFKYSTNQLHTCYNNKFLFWFTQWWSPMSTNSSTVQRKHIFKVFSHINPNFFISYKFLNFYWKKYFIIILLIIQISLQVLIYNMARTFNGMVNNNKFLGNYLVRTAHIWKLNLYIFATNWNFYEILKNSQRISTILCTSHTENGNIGSSCENVNLSRHTMGKIN